MKHDPARHADDPADVLEHNLRKLFAKSYAPVVPAPEFAARLAAEIATRVVDRAWSSGTPSGRTAEASSARPSGWLRALPRRALVAAAAVLVLGLSTWLTVFAPSRGGLLSLDEVLARGCVALRVAGETGWRAVDEREAQRGIDAGRGALDVATPASVSPRSVPRKSVLVRLLFGALEASDAGTPERDDLETHAASSGQATLGPSSYVAIDNDAPTAEAPQSGVRTLQLASGTLSVERYDSGVPWSLQGCGARIELERGAVELAIVDAIPYGGTGSCLLAHIARGVSRAWIDGALSELAPGTTIALQDGRALEASVGAGSPRTGSGRAPAAGVEASGAAAAPGGTPAPVAEKARIEGHVVAPDGIARPRRYTVTLLRHERLPLVSAPRAHEFDGAERFVIDGLEQGDYEVLVESKGLGVWRDGRVTLAAGAALALEVKLARGLALRGRVVDALTGAPIEGAVVISEQDVPLQVIPFDLEPPVAWSASAVTLSDGTFELGSLSAGTRTLRATKKGLGTGWSAPVDPAGTDAGGSVVVRIARGGSVAGLVAHPDGRAWSKTLVVASHIDTEHATVGSQILRMGYGIAETGALGDYAIQDLPPGEYVVINVHDITTASSVRQADVRSGAVTTVDLPERTSGARLVGRVLDHEGRELPGMDVTLQPSGVRDGRGWRSNRTDEKGRFHFEGLDEGEYDAFVGTGMNRRFVHQDTFEVRSASGEVEHDIRLDSGAIRGRVTSAQDGTPCPDAFLLVEKLGPGADHDFEFAGIDSTASDGTFAIEHLRAGTWLVSVYPSQRGLAPQHSREIVIAEDALEARCDFAAPRGASLRITVRDAAGAVVAGSAVTFTDERGEVVQVTASDVTGPGGVLDVPGLAAGRWTVRAQHGAKSSPAQVLDLLPGDDREIALQIAP